MDMVMVAVLVLVGGTVGFLSGMLGIGGGSSFPLLLYVPPLLGSADRREKHHRPDHGAGVLFRP